METPVLKVSRPVAACSRCRGAKTRCDGKLPACTACEKAGKASECSSINDQFAKGKERSYVATLETRIEKLEKRLLEARQRKRNDSVATIVATQDMPPRPPIEAVMSKHREDKHARRKEATDIDELVSNFGVLSVNAAARDFHGFTSTMSYARLVLSAATKEPFPLVTYYPLPSRHEALEAAQHYLSNIYVFTPVFEEASFYASLDAVYHPSGQIASPIDYWTVRFILAIAAISRSQQRDDPYYKEATGHVASALKHADIVLKPGRISSMQAMFLLIQYARYDPCHFDSWTLIGALSRAMVDLGMHQDPSRESSVPKPRLQLRRRIFHCVYATDRSTSIVMGRALSFSDDSANVAFPSLKVSSSIASNAAMYSQFHLVSNDSSFGLYKLRKAQSAWYTDIWQTGGPEPWTDPYPYIWAKYHEMSEWLASFLPVTPRRSQVLAELECLYSHVLLLSPNPKVPLSQVCDLAWSLIFEAGVRYGARMQVAIDDPESGAWLTSMDALRAQKVGLLFLDALSAHWDAILSGQPPRTPAPSSTPGAPLPPEFPWNGPRADNAQRAFGCIYQISELLYRFGTRFGIVEWKNQFDSKSRGIRKDLTSLMG